jgi:hypothetical protein
VLGGGELGLYMDFPRKGDYWLRHMGYTEYDPDRQRRTPPAPDATNQESPQ